MKKLFLLFTVLSTFLYSCEKDEKDPSVTMIKAEAISASSGKAVAKVDQTGDFTIIDHGFVYSMSNSISNELSMNVNPANKVSLGSVIKSDTFAAIIPVNSYNGYASNYKWNVWAYITNEKGTVYSLQSASFIPKQLIVQSVFPAIGKMGDTLTISGNNFETSVNSIQVKFNYNYGYEYVSARVISAAPSEIKVIVPNLTETSSYYYSDYSYNIKVIMGGNETTLQNSFTLLPILTGFSPKTGTFNTYVTISGSQLENISSVLIGNQTASVYDRSNNSVSFRVPNTLKQRKSKIYIVKGGKQIEVPGGEFEMLPLTISAVSPLRIMPGYSFTIEGTNLNNYNTVWIGQTQISSYTSGSPLSVNTPNYLLPGEYKVKVSNGVDTIEAAESLKVVVPSITSISPSSAYSGNSITITGHNFYANNVVYFNGSGYYAETYDSTSYKITVPPIWPGKYRISVYSGGSNSMDSEEFTVLAPTLTSITPTSGNMGTSIIINGEGFGKSTYDVSVLFGNVNASVLSVSNTQINAKVPSGTGTGVWMVTVMVRGYTISNTVQFTIP